MTLKNAMDKYKTGYQLVPPDNHKRNIAERAIQTLKIHFKTILSTTDSYFPANQWYHLLPQAILTLNLLCSTRSNPDLSARAYLFGLFDYNRTTIAPPGMKVIAQVKTVRRTSWGLNGDDGWYLGPSHEHYRRVKVFHPKTNTIRDHDTVTFVPHVIPVPEVDLKDFLCQEVGDIVTLLQHPPTSARLGLDTGDKTSNALL